jgi:hypothetical protein
LLADVVFGRLGGTCSGCRPPQEAAPERDVMSDVDAVRYSYGDLDRRGRFFGLHLPQFVIGWVVIFSLIPMLHAHSVATVVWWALLDLVLVYVAFGRVFDRGLWAPARRRAGADRPGEPGGPRGVVTRRSCTRCASSLMRTVGVSGKP